ncbi:hypothetical protein BKA70DRAFT_1239008 [Coprinopsis sp. MPI-PUGE-AT-0042]|nr:hypothetical protein BKA70DRAFT_1239008 [Coprinopsis sp. MPI-PUGE-AT-0042]
MTSLSAILNDPDSTAPATHHTSRGFYQARWNNSESSTQPSTAYPEQASQGDFGLVPSLPAPCSLYDDRNLYGGSSRQFGTAYAGNTPDGELVTRWGYGDSLYNASLLDPSMLISNCPIPCLDVASPEAATLGDYPHSQTPWLISDDDAQMVPSRDLSCTVPSSAPITNADVSSERRKAKSKSRTNASSGRGGRSRQSKQPKIIKRSACHSCKVKKVRCSSNPDAMLEEDTCMPCINAGIPCDYSPPLEGSKAFNVALRRRQNRETERKRRLPPRVNPRRKRGDYLPCTSFSFSQLHANKTHLSSDRGNGKHETFRNRENHDAQEHSGARGKLQISAERVVDVKMLAPEQDDRYGSLHAPGQVDQYGKYACTRAKFLRRENMQVPEELELHLARIRRPVSVGSETAMENTGDGASKGYDVWSSVPPRRLYMAAQSLDSSSEQRGRGGKHEKDGLVAERLRVQAGVGGGVVPLCARDGRCTRLGYRRLPPFCTSSKGGTYTIERVSITLNHGELVKEREHHGIMASNLLKFAVKVEISPPRQSSENSTWYAGGLYVIFVQQSAHASGGSISPIEEG